MEQTRKKYQAEFATLTKELDLAREEKLFKQAEITRLREELDDLRSKWDDEVLNSSTWSKEKSRLEATLADVVSSRDEAVNAHNEAQGKIVTLLSQVRTLRSSVDDITGERDALLREKRNLENRLEEAKAGLEDLARGESPSLRDAANMDKEILDLKARLAQQEDIAAAAVEKMRRAEALAQETQKDMVVERDASAQLQKEKAALEKSLNEVQVRLVDLETKGYSSASQDIKFLHKRIQDVSTTTTDTIGGKENAKPRRRKSVFSSLVPSFSRHGRNGGSRHPGDFSISTLSDIQNQSWLTDGVPRPLSSQLENQLETQETERSKSARSERNVDRIVRDLQSQIDRKDKQNSQLGDDVSRLRDKVDKLLKTIDELQAAESQGQLNTRRAERELREEKEKTLRLEREVEGWRLRTERGSTPSASIMGGSVAGSVVGYGSMRRSGTQATTRSGLSMFSETAAGDEPEIPKRKSSVGRARAPSLTKGFL